jgi:hypothetical protein
MSPAGASNAGTSNVQQNTVTVVKSGDKVSVPKYNPKEKFSSYEMAIRCYLNQIGIEELVTTHLDSDLTQLSDPSSDRLLFNKLVESIQNVQGAEDLLGMFRDHAN